MQRPTHWTLLIQQTAAQLNLPEQEVKDIVLFFWKEYRQSMGNLQRNKALFPGLGTFHIKPWRLKKKTDKEKQSTKTCYKKYCKGGVSIKKLTRYKRQKAKKDILLPIGRIIVKEAKRKVRIRTKQNKMREVHYEKDYSKKIAQQDKNEKALKNLEEQEKNNRRNLLQLYTKSICRDSSEEEVGDL